MYLSWLVYGFLWVCFDFVARMVGDFRDGLFEDRGCLSHWERCVQVWFSLQHTQHGIKLITQLLIVSYSNTTELLVSDGYTGLKKFQFEMVREHCA